MSEQLSESERLPLVRAASAWAESGSGIAAIDAWRDVEVAVKSIIAARLADLTARLAAVEALVRELHVGGDLTPAGANAFLAVLHPDPSQEKCPTRGCSGDPRYAAPGRAHLASCRYPLPDPSQEGTDA